MYFRKSTVGVVILVTFLMSGNTAQAQATFTWTNLLGGAFQDPMNWDLWAVPGPMDHTVFGLPGFGYDVIFDASPINEHAAILGDEVVFDLRGRIYSLLGSSGEGLRVERQSGIGSLWIRDGRVDVEGYTVIDADPSGPGAVLMISDGGKLSTDRLTLGENVGGSLVIEEDGLLEVTYGLTVGRYGYADVLLDGNLSPAVVNASGGTALAVDPSSPGAVLTLDGTGALWQTSALFLGRSDGLNGPVNVSIINDAQLYATASIYIGGAPGSSLDLNGGTITAQRINIVPGGAFNYLSGGLVLTDSNLTVDSDGLLGSYVSAAPGNRISISGATTVENGGIIDINGGSFSTGVLDVQGDPSRLCWAAGHLGLTASNLTVSMGELLGDFISIDPSRSLNIGGTTIIEPGAWLSIDGGSFSTGAIDTQGNPSAFNFGFGEFNLTASGLDVDSAGLLGSWVGVGPDRKLGVSGLTTVSPGSYLELSGGTLSTGSLDFAGDPARFRWIEGTLNLTDSDLDVTAGGLLGNNLLLDSVHSLGVNGELRVASDGYVHVGYGALTVGRSTDHGSATTLIIDEDGLFDLGASGMAVVGTAGMSGSPGILSVEYDGVLRLTGGRLRAMDLVLQPGAVLDWRAGTLELTQTLVQVDPNGLFGDRLLIEGGQELVLGEHINPGSGHLYVGGPLGSGDLIIREGGLATTSDGTIDYAGVATVQGGGSRWTVRDLLQVSNGLLRIEAGGEVDVQNGVYITDWYSGVSNSVVSLAGPGAMLRVGSFMQIGQPIGYGGPGRLDVGYGTTVDARDGSVSILEQGELILDGGLLVVDVLDNQYGGMLVSTRDTSTLRFNYITDTSAIASFQGHLQFGHDGGLQPPYPFLILAHGSLTPTGNLEVGYNARATLQASNQSVTCMDAVIGSLSTGDGVVILRDSSNWLVHGDLVVGKYGHGTLRQNSSSCYSEGAVTIGELADSSGEVLIDNGSGFSAYSDMTVGMAGYAELLIRNGGASDAARIVLGEQTTGTGFVTVEQGNLNCPGMLEVGHAGRGGLAINTGGWVDVAEVLVGAEATAVGDVIVDDGLLKSAGPIGVGRAGVASLVVENGGEVHNTTATIAAEAGSIGAVTVTGTGSVWANTGKMFIGGDGAVNDDGGDATLTINGGAYVSCVGALVAQEPGSTGIVYVDGTGSQWENFGGLADITEWITVGVRGDGEVHVTNGGRVSSGVLSVGTSLVAGGQGASGIAIVDGTGSLLDAWGMLMVGGLDPGSVTASNQARIMAYNLDVLADGSLRIETAASMTTVQDVYIGQHVAGPARVVVTGAGSDWTHQLGTLTIGDGAEGLLMVENGATTSMTGETIIGLNGGQGNMEVAGNAHVLINGDLTLGFLGNGEVAIIGGGQLTVDTGGNGVQVGFLPPGSGMIEVTGEGSRLDASEQDLWFGNYGSTGSMHISDQGTVLSYGAEVGMNNAGIGDVLVENPGSIWGLSGPLTIGSAASGSMEVRDAASVTSSSGTIGATGSGNVLLTGDASTWSVANALTVAYSGQGDLEISDGALVANAYTVIAFSASGVGYAHVHGVDSRWNNSGRFFVGGSDTAAGGTGTLTVGDGPGTGGTINIGDTLKVWAPGAVHLDGGIINSSRLSIVEGAWTWGGGELNVTSPTFEFIVGAAGPFGATLVIPSDNLMTVAGQTTVDPGAVLDAAGYIGYSRVVNEGTIISHGDVILGDTSIYKAYSGGGSLVVGADNVTLKSLGFLEVDFPLTITGGTLTAPNGLLIEPAYMLSACGAIDARLAVPMGTTITATGDLALGDADAADGFYSDGVLEVGEHTVTLHDANQAVLGSITTLGGRGSGGSIVAANGVLVEFGKNVGGYGTIDTPDDPLLPAINNGDVSGNSLAEPITLTGYAKGVGTFDNVVFAGTFAPGFSPAAVHLGSARYAGTLEIELGGLSEGESDLIHHSGDVVLGGVLDVLLWDSFVPMPGSTITFMDFAGNLSGEFDEVVNSTGYPGLMLDYVVDQHAVMIRSDYLVGDLNLDGFVGIADLNMVLGNWNQYVTAGSIFQGDPSGDGFVGIVDLNEVLGNWNAGTPPASPAVPEPAGWWIVLLAGLLLMLDRGWLGLSW